PKGNILHQRQCIPEIHGVSFVPPQGTGKTFMHPDAQSLYCMVKTRESGKPAEKPVAEEIQELMAGIITAAENVDIDKAYSRLTRDPDGLFFINNKHYHHDALLALFRENYGKLRSQRLRVSHSEVIVTGPD